MDIKFIAWLCEKARGFRHIEKMYDIECPDGMYIAEGLIERHRMRWPLLLQRAIEGAESTFGTIVITQHAGGWSWNTLNNWRTDWDGSRTMDHNLYKSADEAKEQALKYIYEQENDND